MVLSLSVPSFSRSSSSSSQATPETNNNNNNQNQRRLHRPSTSTKHPWRPTSVISSSTDHHPSSSSNSTSSTILRTPFTTSRTRTLPKTEEQLEEHHREQAELNTALETLARVFPDVKVEVFREMLVRFDGNSRVEVCVDELIRHKKEWVAGRWNVPDGDNAGSGTAAGAAGGVVGGVGEDEGAVPYEERFRSDEYKAAVKAALGKEFTALSKSTMDAVLAEVNFCYHRARPTLRDLARRTWRATFNNLFPSFKRKKDRDEHPLLMWQRRADGEAVPKLKETGCAELDRELHEALLAPLLRQKQEEQEGRDYQLAEELNESEAKAADALYECECCLADVTFEQISTCSVAGHVICYGCIQRTVHEALFGQGWNKSVDMERSTLKCLAPLSHGNCEGSLHPGIVKQAILLDKAGFETHQKFEDRLASEALLKSQYKLIRCPFCSYAEVDPVYHPSVRGVRWRFRSNGALAAIILVIVYIDLICLLAVPALILWLMDPSAIPAILQNSLLNLCLKTRPKRFTCAHPACRRASCITCQKPWRDPHVCHEPLLLDLRATVEAARTAAVKRTCPRCGLSFVKSSGCNKLTCVCGYSMCYLCRKALGPPLEPALQLRRRRPLRRNQENIPPGEEEDIYEDNDQPEEPEGYRHFCEHFRPNPGSRCTECNKCDLYQSEDEDAVARRAGERAEREWRIRQGMTGGAGAVVPGVGNRNVNLDFSTEGKGKGKRGSEGMWWDNGKSDWNWKYWMVDMWSDGSWRVEGQTAVDWVVERVVVVDEI
ncbi:uncharacterized protein ACHE_31140A [Aspergillus chevalieri]|uniref:RING-type domain-containing protein n=1 Tax=Aspergillus chevalieri TaxID=182096 RepID=A0A7R7ZM62_ASPCH|nr:uncharacterized protein ACHE_31140A [Aspergillus chevalieri]BCR87153.1 hypothetical protein ACHE_31140A [Aspergillus chevalieri]